MVTTVKKTTPSTKKILTEKVKKPTAKKVVTDAGKTVKASAKPPVQKLVAKPPVAKTVTKKSIQTKSAPSTSAKVKKSPVKRNMTGAKAGSVSPEERYKMIATAAYYLAERRGFASGYEMQDWIAAEAETDTKLSG